MALNEWGLGLVLKVPAVTVSSSHVIGIWLLGAQLAIMTSQCPTFRWLELETFFASFFQAKNLETSRMSQVVTSGSPHLMTMLSLNDSNLDVLELLALCDIMLYDPVA